jgi:hypothetical protein
MFRLIEPSSGQTQNIVLVHSVSVHHGAHSLNESKHVAEFLIVNIDYEHMLCLLTD